MLPSSTQFEALEQPLKHYFEVDKFRSGQYEIIKANLKIWRVSGWAET
jgi:superfamily II DNA helicase RecQ